MRSVCRAGCPDQSPARLRQAHTPLVIRNHLACVRRMALYLSDPTYRVSEVIFRSRLSHRGLSLNQLRHHHPPPRQLRATLKKTAHVPSPSSASRVISRAALRAREGEDGRELHVGFTRAHVAHVTKTIKEDTVNRTRQILNETLSKHAPDMFFVWSVNNISVEI